MLVSTALICLVFALVCGYSNGLVTTNCPNSCSSHGYCTNTPHSKCQCYPGYAGADCSQRVCPAARAWVDYPTGNSTAHAVFTECSNMGVCDRTTGVCQCRPGFGGDACDIMLCPMALNPNSLNDYSTHRFPCSSNGRCMSLRDASEYNNLLDRASNVPYEGWDADMIHGCVCDKGWEGSACELRSCPKGDDPLTDGYDDVQLIDCKCTSCQGGFYLTFQDQQTPLISFNASAELIQYRLSQLSNFDYVDVSQVMGPAVCSDTGSITKITFRALTTLKSAIKMTTAYGLDGHILGIVSHGAVSQLDFVQSLDGTREYATCSNRGDCDFATGVCSCYGGFVDSDGAGNEGTIGDCGYRLYFPYNHTLITSTTIHNGTFTYYNTTKVTTNCPFAYDAICAGNGTCNENTGMCTCFDGYSGSACTNLTCATSFAWFGDIDSQHRGVSICSGVGECDGTTGLCVNCGAAAGLFTGDRCEYLSCYSDGQHVCSGNGACLTLKEMAQFAYNEQKELAGTIYEDAWDAEHIRGCSCYRAISIDNQYDPNYYQIINAHSFNYTTNKTEYFSDYDLEKFYRGPYAYAATNFQGYNCLNAQCPKGDNQLSKGVNEIQVIHCRADNGTFKLTFRENTTLPISYNATAEELEFALEQIYTISDVKVTFAGGAPHANPHNHSVCNLFNNISVYIEFMTEYGDLPLLIPDTALIDSFGYGLDNYRNEYIMNVTEYQKGTKYDLECSGMGTCNEFTGRCSCFEGFSSSNGSTSAPGDRGDCGFVNKFYTCK